MNKTRNAMMMCLLTASASFSGLGLAQEDAAQQPMQKKEIGQNNQQAADPAAPGAQPAQMNAMPSMTPEEQAAMEAWQKAGTPGAEHQQLIDGMVGTWTAKTSMWTDPDVKPMVSTGTEVNTAVLDGRYVRMEFSGDMMGEQFSGIGHLGYDNVTNKYFASWVDSMSTGLYVAHGKYDPGTRTYTFHGTMPNPVAPGTKIEIRQTLHMIDADHHSMEWYEMRDGTERKTMQIEYTRAG